MTVPSSEGSGVANHASLLQISYYVGTSIANILYGIELFLYFKTIQVLLINKGTRKKNLLYALFSSTMLFLVTLWVMTDIIFGWNMWLVQSDYPGGPDAYLEKNVSVWYMSWSMTGVIILQLMTDALMIYRCWIMWNGPSIIIPIIFWLATLALGLSVDSIVCSPGGGALFDGVARKLSIAYYTVSIFLNTTLTCKICYHIMQHAWKVQKHIGPEHASLYFTAITIIVESVFPYTLSGIAFLISLGVASSLSTVFLCVYVLMMSISPQMLILRVIKGKALNADTFKQPISTIQFSPGTMPESQPFESGEARTHNLQTLPKAYPLGGHADVAEESHFRTRYDPGV